MEFVEEFTSAESSRIAKEFARLKDVNYLDTAGAALYAAGQIHQISALLTQNLFCNPHTSRATENIVDQVRYQILKHFNADPEEYSVIFTSGATASLKIVGECFKFTDDDAFYYLTDSHTSVLGMRAIVATEKVVPITKQQLLADNLTINNPGLITFPAQCNFNGFKFPLQLIRKLQDLQDMFVCLDAASFVATNPLDLTIFKPDYVCVSFYKIFGYPSGLGALIVSKRGAERLEKRYYGGGTVKIALTRSNWHQKRDLLHERFEDGTIPFLSIIALQTCFQFMESLLGSDFMHRTSRHVYNLGKYLYDQLKNLKHHNDQPVVTFHHETGFEDVSTQGGIVNFSLRHADGSFVGFAELASIAALHNILLRTGCFCNPGSCQSHFGLSEDDLMKQFNAGHICGDDNDLIDGAPTGSTRVSFGYMTTKDNVDKLVQVVRDCYQETSDRLPVANERLSIKSKPKLKSIRIYPIKSCAPMVTTGSWKINSRGLEYDREWVIVNSSNGTALTQKHETRMCLVRPSIDASTRTMRLEFDGMDAIEIPFEHKNGKTRGAKVCETKVCGDRIQGIDCGDDVADWLNRALSATDLRLIRQSPDVGRKNGVVSLSNQAQFLLVSQPSVQWLMNHVEEWDNEEQDVENIVSRFRGNLVIDDLKPLAETEFKEIRIGKAAFHIQGPCTRCQMICIDQTTGQKTTEPLRTIGRLFKGKMRFGIYLSHVDGDGMTLRCGDEIYYN